LDPCSCTGLAHGLPKTESGLDRLAQPELASLRGGGYKTRVALSSFYSPLLLCRCADGLRRLLMLAPSCGVMLLATRLDLEPLLLFSVFSHVGVGYDPNSCDGVDAD
jgi:hypothetical protein